MKNAKHYIYIELIICHFNIPDAILRTVIRVLVLIQLSFQTHITYKIYIISLIAIRNDLVNMYQLATMSILLTIDSRDQKL